MDGLDPKVAKALGLVAEKPVAKLDLSQVIKDRYHHRMTLQAIAQKYGVSHQAVSDRLAKFTAQLGDPDELQAFTDAEERIQAAIKQRYSSHLLATDLTKCSPRDAAIVYGTIYDKNRLQTGQSTSNQSVFFHCVQDSDTQDVVPDPDE